MKQTRSLSIALPSLLAGVLICGCSQDPNPDIPAAIPTTPKIVRDADTFRPTTNAGIPVATSEDPTTYWAQTASSKSFASRPDPFALHPNERAFDRDQASERIFDSTGFTVSFEPPVDNTPLPTVEAQPYRRLAGVIVGDSVLALIDMGDGQGLKLIHPGQVINGWTVASIDSEKAVLRRSGTTLPHEVIVRLESPPFGSGSTPGGQSGGQNNGPRTPGGPGKSGPQTPGEG